MATRKKPEQAVRERKYVAIENSAYLRGGVPPFGPDDENEFNCVWFETATAAGAWVATHPDYTVYEIGRPVEIVVSVAVQEAKA